MTVIAPEREVQEAFQVLEPIVDDEGGIKAIDVVKDLVKWMENAKSFDTRIVYLCVVNQTGSKEILENFLKTGGWAQIAKWLTLFTEKNQFAGVREILKCLQKLPVTVDTLKLKVPEGSEVPGKMVRKLRKNEDQKIKELSTSIFKSWTTLLEQDNAKKEAKKAKKRELEKAEKKAKGPQLADNLMTNMFEADKVDRQAAKDEKKRKKDAKKRKLQEKKQASHDLVSNILSSMPGNHDTVEETMPNASSPPISRDTPSPEPKRERKPGAKTVRWTDQASSLPLENVREFEVDPNERENVNSEQYKRRMDLEAFKDAEVLQNPDSFVGSENNLGDLAPKRQWRVPRKIRRFINESGQKNLDNFVKDTEEKQKATELCSRTLQRIYPATQIPDTPTEPEPRPTQIGLKIPKIPQQLEKEAETIEAPAPASGGPAMPNIDLGQLGINTDTLRDVLSVAAVPSSNRNPYERDRIHSGSGSPPMDGRFGGIHAPTPPREHNHARHAPPHHHHHRSPPPGHRDQRYAPYNRGPSPPYHRSRFENERFGGPPRDRYGRDDRGSNRGFERSPQRDADSQRRSRSPPYHSRRSPPRHFGHQQASYMRDSRDRIDTGYRR